MQGSYDAQEKLPLTPHVKPLVYSRTLSVRVTGTLLPFLHSTSRSCCDFIVALWKSRIGNFWFRAIEDFGSQLANRKRLFVLCGVFLRLEFACCFCPFWVFRPRGR